MNAIGPGGWMIVGAVVVLALLIICNGVFVWLVGMIRPVEREYADKDNVIARQAASTAYHGMQYQLKRRRLVEMGEHYELDITGGN